MHGEEHDTETPEEAQRPEPRRKNEAETHRVAPEPKAFSYWSPAADLSSFRKPKVPD
jgi:hypothetical protein